MADIMSPETRSRVMSRIRSKNTLPERLVAKGLRRYGFRFRCYCKELPGRPDFVFYKERIAVFVDGDFWHGFRFPQWMKKLPEFWQKKITINRARDRKNFRKLRTRGWKVVRIWEHQIESDLEKALSRLVRLMPALRSPIRTTV